MAKQTSKAETTNQGKWKAIESALDQIKDKFGDGSIMKLITSGAACNGIGGGVALYSGGFSIVGSTGGFVNAIGGGMLGFGGNFNNGIGVFDIKGAGTNLN